MAVTAFASSLVLVDSGGIPVTQSAKPEFATPFIVVTANAPAATMVDDGGYPVALLNADGTAYEVG
jgi:hypothetical protein